MAFDALKRLFQRGEMARTPGFVPESVGRAAGEKPTAVVLPPAKPIAPAPYKDTSGVFGRLPESPAPNPQPLRGTSPLGATTQAIGMNSPAMEAVHDPFREAPLRDLRNEAKFREQFRNVDMSERQYADPYTQAKYDKLYAQPMAEGKSVRDLERPGAGGRLKLALMGALMGAANNPTGDIGGLIGGALGGAAGSAINPTRGREWQYDMGEGRQIAEQIGREQQQQGVQARLAEIFARMGANQARAQRDITSANATQQNQTFRAQEHAWKGQDQDWKARERAHEESQWGAKDEGLELDKATKFVTLQQMLRTNPLQAQKLQNDIQTQKLNQERIALANQLSRETNQLRVQEMRTRLAQIDQQIRASQANTSLDQMEIFNAREEVKRKLMEKKGFSSEEADLYINDMQRR